MNPMDRRGIGPGTRTVLDALRTTSTMGIQTPTDSHDQGDEFQPRQGELTKPLDLHPQPADNATIIVQGNATDVALLVEYAKRIGLNVEPAIDLEPSPEAIE